MILVADIGNTNITFGVYEKKDLLRFWRLNTSPSRTCDEYWLDLKLLCDDSQFNLHEISALVICSVVPDMTQIFAEMTVKYLDIQPMLVTSSLNLGLKLLVDEPLQVGADRLANMVAGKESAPLPQIIVDVGTATTFDVLNSDGDYIGGAIAPGMITAATDLMKKAAQLYRIEIRQPEHVIGKNTREHMQSGIFIGHIAMIEGMIERIKKEISCASPYVIITGGFCDEIARHTNMIDRSDRLLTLNGIRLIYERNIKIDSRDVE